MQACAGLAAAASLLAGCGGSSKSKLDLVLVSSKDGVYRLYGIDADGSHRTRLTSGTVESSRTPSAVFYEVQPAWSPTGRSIVFSSERAGKSHLFVMQSDGKGVRQLTRGKDEDSYPSWSPDGKRIAFIHGYPGFVEVMNANGTGMRSLSGGQAELTGAAWSPDGRWIAYARREPGSPVREIWLVHPDGTDRHRLTSLGAVSYQPAWSPDGKELALVSDYGGSGFDLYVIGVSGLGLRDVTKTDADEFEPSWSPGGKLIAFMRDGSIVTTDQHGGEHVLSEGDNDSNPVWRPRVKSSYGSQ